MAKPILTQPRPTRGKTVGRAVIKSFIHDYLHGQDADFKPLYTQGRFNAMVEGLKSDREYSIYVQYVSVYNGISEELVRAQAYAQQAQHGLLHLQALLSDVRRAAEQASLLQALLAQYGLPLDVSEADGLKARLAALFISMDTLVLDPGLFATGQSYHDHLLWPALRGLSAYNALMELLAEALEFEEILGLVQPLDDLKRDLSAYAADTLAARALLDAGDERLAFFDALFRPVRLEGAAPAPEALAAVRETLSGPENLQSGVVQQLFIQLLGSAS